MRLENKVAVVTGAGRGIGRAVAIAFAQEGADVLVNYVSNSQAADETVAEIEKLGRKAVAVKADVASTEDAKNMIETAVKELGGVDILVNNAGVSIPSMFLKMTEEGKGDLNQILEHIMLIGELTDDISMLRIEYSGKSEEELLQPDVSGITTAGDTKKEDGE